MTTLFCENAHLLHCFGRLSIRILKTVRENALFLKTGLRVEKSQQQLDLINGPHKRLWFPCTSHFHLLLVFGFSVYCRFVYSVLAYCACSMSSSPFLVNVKCHLEAWNMNYSVSVIFSGSVWTQIFLQRCPGRR